MVFFNNSTLNGSVGTVGNRSVGAEPELIVCTQVDGPGWLSGSTDTLANWRGGQVVCIEAEGPGWLRGDKLEGVGWGFGETEAEGGGESLGQVNGVPCKT